MAMGTRSNSLKDYETPSMDERRDSTEDSTDNSSDSGTIYYATGDFTPLEDNQVGLSESDEVIVLERVNSEWWWVEVDGAFGYVPSNHLSEKNPLEEVEDQWQDDEYFSSYSSLKLHHEMLADSPRTLAYKKAIEDARNFIQGKIVMDLGCGTGILSLFCAKLGGARKVYAVEASDMANHVSQLVTLNGLGGQVEVLQIKAEEVELEENVDLIISEWMGTLLLFELMLESVLITRDRCLKDSGVMWPSEAVLFLVPCSAHQCYRDKITFWEDVYGFDFSPLVPVAQTEMLSKPIYNHILAEEDCLSSPRSIMKLHLKSLQIHDIESTECFFRCSVTKAGTFHGFGSWFEVKFGDIPEEYEYQAVTLSTAPGCPLTHWKQDLFMVDCPLSVRPGDTLEGCIRITRNKCWRRHLKVVISYKHITSDNQHSEEFTKQYKLWR